MDKTGLDTQLQSVFLPLMVADDDKELDGIAQFLANSKSRLVIFSMPLTYSYPGNGCSVGQHRQDERLMGGVPAVDVQEGSFREAQLLAWARASA